MAKRASASKKPPGEKKTASSGAGEWQEQSRNAVLASLNASDRELALAEGELVDFTLRQQVYLPETQIGAAYFPLTCVLSVVNHMRDGTMIEIGTIGREGTTAIPLIMGANTTVNESFCQVPGRAWKMPAAAFTKLLRSSDEFHDSMNRYLQGYMNMLGQIAACNRLHNVYERCCRWLLMTQDRVDGNGFPLTHEFLASMLGSPRSGVTLAAATLQKAGLIEYRHGWITILDRQGLVDVVCECYDVANDQFLKPM